MQDVFHLKEADNNAAASFVTRGREASLLFDNLCSLHLS